MSYGWSKSVLGSSLKARVTVVILLLVGLAAATPTARADWSTWQDVGNGVWVSYTQVNRDTWTWKFKNVGTTTITYMRFTYEDKDGEHPDILPGSLRPNAVIGGWAAFTASSRPTINIVEINRR